MCQDISIFPLVTEKIYCEVGFPLMSNSDKLWEIVISNLIKALCTSEEHSRQFSWKPNKSTLPINVDWGNLCKNKPLVFDFQRN